MQHELLREGVLERLGAYLLTVLAFLLPVFFIPSISFPLTGGKALFFFLFVIAVFALFVFARLKDGQLELPDTPLLFALAAVSLVFIVSLLFAPLPLFSFAGLGFEAGTAVNILLSSLAVFLISVSFKKREQVFGCYLAFLAAFFILVFFHFFRLLLGPEVFSFGIFTDAASNMVGKWNDLGVFFGASALLSLITLEFLSLNKLFQLLLVVALLLSLFFLALVNFSTVWFMLGLFALVFLVYRVSFRLGVIPENTANKGSLSPPSRRFAFASLLTLVISVVFIVMGGSLGGRLSSHFGISTLEARPSWQATFEVARHTLAARPLLGAGPNRFGSEWLAAKPAGINDTLFWNTDFDSGVGLIPTFLITTGIFGLFALAVFFALFLYSGFRAVLAEGMELFSRYLVASSFFISLFLWVFSVFYVPSQTILAITFLFTGLFIASLSVTGEVPRRTISFGDNPRFGFIFVLFLILSLIGAVTLGFFLTTQYAAAVHFQKGVIAFNRDGNVNRAEEEITKATTLLAADHHFRALTELTLSRMGALLRQDTKTVSAETIRAQFQGLLGTALTDAREALALDPTNYQNLLELGHVYEAVVPLKIEGAYESAKASYEQALSLNPASPAIELTLARLELAKGDHAAARAHIGNALAKKRNYLEAIFLLSQLQVEDGDLKAAIQSAEAASFIAPDDSTVHFQLGLLRFNNREYQGAVTALERAVTLSPSYANAKYFLGLSYEKVGRIADAITQLGDLVKANPDNAAIALMVKNLKAGRPSSASAPVEVKPEKRKLPVRESGGAKKTTVGFDEP